MGRKKHSFEPLPPVDPDPFPRRVAFAEEFEGGFLQVIINGPITAPVIEAMQAFLDRQKTRIIEDAAATSTVGQGHQP